MWKELTRLGATNFGLGIPALAGVVLGIRLYTGGRPWWSAALLAFVPLIVILWIARNVIARRPRLGGWLMEPWILSAVLVTALVTDLVLYLTMDEWFPTVLGSAQGTTLDKLSATLVGAVTAFAALVWTKDAADAKGYFWPSTQFKYGLETFYKQLANPPCGNSEPYNAIYSDVVADTDIDGWSFLSRRKRAKLLADYLDGHADAHADRNGKITPPPSSPNRLPR